MLGLTNVILVHWRWHCLLFGKWSWLSSSCHSQASFNCFCFFECVLFLSNASSFNQWFFCTWLHPFPIVVESFLSQMKCVLEYLMRNPVSQLAHYCEFKVISSLCVHCALISLQEPPERHRTHSRGWVLEALDESFMLRRFMTSQACLSGSKFVFHVYRKYTVHLQASHEVLKK